MENSIGLKLTLGILFMSLCIKQAFPHVMSNSITWKNKKFKAKLLENTPTKRRFLLSSSMKDQPITIDEESNYPTLHTGSLVMDSLFSLTNYEFKKNSVNKISDSAFKPSRCQCFETGELWKYVWTRDISYSAFLSTALIDPNRTKNSLLFKLSQNRSGELPEIVQDTGTGGSWPISSDRIVWAIGAFELLHNLDQDRLDFAKISYKAIRNTISRDRESIFDPHDGLYKGETSFLDWREQTYPDWMAKDVANIAESKSLSTNILHYTILQTASKLAKLLDHQSDAVTYSRLASNLKIKINDSFWLDDLKMYGSFKINGVTTKQFDLLGNSLAIIFDVANKTQAKLIVKNYPMTKAGPPVVWPQKQFTPIYHNRAIWPFVTSLFMMAAKKAKNISVFNHCFQSMVKGTAFSLSNMENFEFTTLDTFVKDGNYSGPVLNSKRQLWSVAGFHAAIIKNILGITPTEFGLKIDPYITEEIRTKYFRSNQVKLNNITYRNKNINFTFGLPNNGINSKSHFIVKKIFLNNMLVHGSTINSTMLQPNNEIFVELIPLNPSYHGTKKLVTNYEWRNIFSPKTPSLSLSFSGQKIHLSINSFEPAEIPILFNIYKNGNIWKRDISATNLTDSSFNMNSVNCYVVESRFKGYSNYSFPSQESCIFQNETYYLSKEDETLHSMDNASTEFRHGKFHFNNWGDSNQELSGTLKVLQSGWYNIQVEYGNSFNEINNITTGITATVKKLEITDTQTEKKEEQIVTMPQRASWADWGHSTPSYFYLQKGKLYKLSLQDYFNMSSLSHFRNYKFAGGQTSLNKGNISKIRIKKCTQ